MLKAGPVRYPLELLSAHGTPVASATIGTAEHQFMMTKWLAPTRAHSPISIRCENAHFAGAARRGSCVLGALLTLAQRAGWSRFALCSRPGETSVSSGGYACS